MSPLRVLTLADAPALARLHADSFDAPWSEVSFRNLLAQDSTLGWAFDAEPIAAFILIQTLGEEAEILTLATAKAHRRAGLAQALVDHVTGSLPGVRKLHLEVAEDNHPALALYRSCGFDEIGRRANYYRRSTGRIDAILMAINLTGQTGHIGPSTRHGSA